MLDVAEVEQAAARGGRPEARGGGEWWVAEARLATTTRRTNHYATDRRSKLIPDSETLVRSGPGNGEVDTCTRF